MQLSLQVPAGGPRDHWRHAIGSTGAMPSGALAPRHRDHWRLSIAPIGASRSASGPLAPRPRAYWRLANGPTSAPPSGPLAPLLLFHFLAPLGCASQHALQSCCSPLSPSPFPRPLMLHGGPTPLATFPDDDVTSCRRPRRPCGLRFAPGIATGHVPAPATHCSSFSSGRACSPLAVACGQWHPRRRCC